MSEDKSDIAFKTLFGKDLIVTERSADEIFDNCLITPQTIQQLPQKAAVVEIGSGLFQEFAQKVKGIRPDVTVISVDPTLAFSANREDVIVSDTEKRVQYWIDPFKRFIDQEDIDMYQQLQAKRLKHASQFGGVAALAPRLPIREGSISLLVDSWAACNYLKSEEEFKEYITEVSKTLISGGEARMFPVRYARIAADYEVDKAMTVLAEMLSQTFQESSGFEPHCYRKDGEVGLILKRLSQLPEVTTTKE
jgi:hypothetical protein